MLFIGHIKFGPHQKRWLDEGKIQTLVDAVRSIPTPDTQLAEAIRTEADYFASNAHRLRYPTFRKQHLFVGSGGIEAGCKTVIGHRLKRSGMFWTIRGANALRCRHLNARFRGLPEALPSGLNPTWMLRTRCIIASIHARKSFHSRRLRRRSTAVRHPLL